MDWRVGIHCAADTELEPFLKQIKDCTVTERAMLKFYEGKINGVPIVTLYSGVGKVNAAIAAQLLIDTFHVNAIINAGTAGGVAPAVKLFDVVVSEKSAYHDMDDDILTDFHPWMPTIWFSAGERLLEAARCAEKRYHGAVRFGKTVTGEHFIQDDAREEILEKYEPLAVDMETAAVAHVCYVNEIPFLAVRAITDTASHSGLENFEHNCERASETSKNFVLKLLAELHA